MARGRSGGGRARERAGLSFFAFVAFFAVFGAIVLTELFLLERAPARARHDADLLVPPIGEALTEPPPPPPRDPNDAKWQPVLGTRHKFFVYSAYIERRTTYAVRVIGAARTRGAERVWCRIWLVVPGANTTHVITVRARVKPVRENWNLGYSACFILCPLHEEPPEGVIGGSVAVISAPNGAAGNLLPIINTKGPGKGVGVCVKPLHFSYERPLWLLEWIELNALLGARQLTMYAESVGPSVACVLDHYVQGGLIKLLPWKLDIKSKVEIRNQGQFAAFNDCLYRAMSEVEWLLVLDVDEVIIPVKEPTITKLLTTMHPQTAAAYLFRNAFFYEQWPDDIVTKNSPLMTQRKTRRWLAPHAVKNRSKYAVRPRLAVELGNHFVWEFVSGASSAAVPPHHALLHHYRSACEFGGNDCLRVASVTDRTAHRFAADLLGRVRARHVELEQRCRLPPLEPPAPSSTNEREADKQ